MNGEAHGGTLRRFGGTGCLPVCLAVALFGAVAAAPVVARPQPLLALAPNAVVLAFGDSLTAGVGGSGRGYPDMLAQRIERRVVSAGVPGDTTADGRRRLDEALGSERPALLILCLGVNDFLREVPADQIRRNLDAMLETAAAHDVPVLMLGLPRPGDSVVSPLFAAAAEQGGGRGRSLADDRTDQS